MLKTGFDVLDIHSAGPVEGGLNLLLSDEPFGKTYFTVRIVDTLLKAGWLVHYLDLDTFFTVYTHINLFNLLPSENLLLYNPDADTIDSIITQICSIITQSPQLIIIDSIPSLYHIFAGKAKASEVNWRLGLYLHLLLKHIKPHDSIIAVSMRRAKKVRGELWLPSYPGGMLIHRVGSAVYDIHRQRDYLDLKIPKHQIKSLEGRRWSIRITL